MNAAEPALVTAAIPDLKGKAVLITGANAGLGAEMARQLAAKGWDLALCARRTERLEELRTEVLRSHPDRRVAVAALDAGLPSVVLAGQVLVGRRETMGLGISGTYAVAETREEIDAAILDPVGTLRARAARVARTWSPAR